MNRILLYTENYVGGGGNKYLADIVNSVSENYEVFLVSNINGLSEVDFSLINREYTHQQIDIYAFNRIDGIFVNFKKLFPLIYKIFRKIYFYLFLFYYQNKNIKILSSVIDDIDPFLVISCNGGYPAALSCLDLIFACKKKAKKCILTIVSMPQKKSFIDIFYKEIGTLVDRVIVNSNLIKDSLVAGRKFIKENISVIYNSVGNSDSVAWDFSKKSEEILLGYVGRIERSKGSYILLDAFKNIGKYENVRLLMVGSGPELDDVKEYSKKLGLDNKVIFTGYLSNNIYSILSMIDIFVFPSLWEGFPYSILEAMNAGKIIVSTNVGGIPEAITDKKEGILVNPRDVIKLSNVLEDIILNFDRYSYLGLNAKQKIDKNFRFDNFREKIVNLIKSFNN